MTRISSSDHIMILLRQKLERAAELKKGQKARAVGGTARDDPSNIQRIRALAQLDTLSDEDVERSMIQGLLVEELGEALVNDPKFQQLVSRITEMLTHDEAGKALLAAARQELKD
jgi:hypothetical protein